MQCIREGALGQHRPITMKLILKVRVFSGDHRGRQEKPSSAAARPSSTQHMAASSVCWPS